MPEFKHRSIGRHFKDRRLLQPVLGLLCEFGDTLLLSESSMPNSTAQQPQEDEPCAVQGSCVARSTTPQPCGLGQATKKPEFNFMIDWTKDQKPRKHGLSVVRCPTVRQWVLIGFRVLVSDRLPVSFGSRG